MFSNREKKRKPEIPLIRLSGSVEQKNKPVENLRIGVSPAGYDNMLPILKSMNLNAIQIPNEQLATVLSKRAIDCYLANCGSGPYSRDAIAESRRFVADGGVILASDWKDEFIQKCCPGVFSTERDGRVGHIAAEVVDNELRVLIGPSIELHFDMAAWRYASWVSDYPQVIKGINASPVKVHLKWDNRPLVLTFSYGRGYFIYTSFHNSAQTSAQEKILLKFLALKPVSMASGIPVPVLYEQFGKKG